VQAELGEQRSETGDEDVVVLERTEQAEVADDGEGRDAAATDRIVGLPRPMPQA